MYELLENGQVMKVEQIGEAIQKTYYCEFEKITEDKLYRFDTDIGEYIEVNF